jgi:hypothetical protein
MSKMGVSGVSTQNCHLQLRGLEHFVAQPGWRVAALCEDMMNGAQARRPGRTRLVADAAAGKFHSEHKSPCMRSRWLLLKNP